MEQTIQITVRQAITFLGGVGIGCLAYWYLSHAFIRRQADSLGKGKDARVTLAPILDTIDTIYRMSLEDLHNPKSFVVLVFGPSIRQATPSGDRLTHSVALKRASLRSALEKLHFTVHYGEDFEKARGDYITEQFNMALKEKLVARKAQAILVLASSVGSATEVGIFSQIPDCCNKMVIAIHADHSEGFLAKGAATEAEAMGAKLLKYDDSDLQSCKVQTLLVAEALRLYQGFLARKLADPMLVHRPSLQ